MRSDDAAVVHTPPLGGVHRLVAVLQVASWRPALGGSGLLVALGLADTAADWDVTVDAPVESVIAALDRAGLAYRDETRSDGSYASDRRLVFDGPIDLLINFALRGPDGVEQLPTRVTGCWRGLPLADPVVWARAYRLLGRDAKAELLEQTLHHS
ncbi:hypothetical protein [Microlunatus speluncae]|uniref:hypothetical protein n=1 Tax=Microlunatus speluncae TaxID=2594267 RepID=UPI0012666185|nr:hypothetical protein [Microlunatus speluncae]